MDPIDYGRFLAALLFVLGLIALTAWLARRFRLGPGAPAGAGRRLALVEAMPLDARRKLVLIRRDATEHLLLLSPEGTRLIEGGSRTGAKCPRQPGARKSDETPALRLLSAATLAWYFSAGDAAAQSVSVDLGAGGTVTGQLVRLVLLITVLSLAPSILVMITSFTRVVVVLAFLRSALGLQQTPPNAVLISLALFVTAFIMAPTLEQAYRQGLEPLLNEDIDEMAAFERAMAPFRTFMLAQVRAKDLELFLDIGDMPELEKPEDTPLRALIPAFMISELRRAFEIGF